MKKAIFTLFLLSSGLLSFTQNWIPMAAGYLPENHAIMSISGIEDHVIWAVACYDPTVTTFPVSARPVVIRSSNGGLTWVTHQIKDLPATLSFQIIAVDSLIALVSIQDYGTGPGRSIYKTVDGGERWTLVLNNDDSCGVGLHSFGDGQHWLAHNYYDSSRSSDGGITWQDRSIPGYTIGSELQVFNSGANMSAVAGDTLWNGTTSGRIVRFTDYGASSIMINTGLGSSNAIYSIAFENHLNGLLFYEGANGDRKIAKSTDGGGTWTVLPEQQQPPYAIWNIASIPGSPGHYALASWSPQPQDAGIIAITRDFGTTWTVDKVEGNTNSVLFTSPSTGWVGGGFIHSAAQPSLYKYVGPAIQD